MPITGSEVLTDKDTATLLAAADAQRRYLLIQNQGPNQIAVGGEDVTLKTGLLLTGTATPTSSGGGILELTKAVHGESVCQAWYGLARTADQVTGAATQVVVDTDD